MTNKELKYGVIINNELLLDLNSDQQRTAYLGQIVKYDSILGKGNVAVRFLKDDDNWDTNTFCCAQNSILPISEKLYPYIQSISSPMNRVKLLQDTARYENLNSITKEITVQFRDRNEVHLGVIKFMGPVRGMGHCVGIKLHKKKADNKCNGSCAGTQYFTCLPGYGVFTTIDRLTPYTATLGRSGHDSTAPTSELDAHLHRNIATFDLCLDKPQHEEIVTKFGEYAPQRPLSTSISTMRNSLSLQNIIDAEPPPPPATNSNNDYDQNTIIQPDQTYLIHKQKSAKSEMDLHDLIGNSWHGSSEPKKAPIISSENGAQRNGTRNKSTNILSHFIDGTSTRNKTYVQTAKFYDGDGSHTLPRKSNGVKEKTTGTKQYNAKCAQRSPTAAAGPKYVKPRPGATNDLSIGSLVEVSNDVSSEPLYGVVRWMGADAVAGRVLVGVELEEEHVQLPLTLTDGTHGEERYFRCAENRALFVPLAQCNEDSRFLDGVPTPVHQREEPMFCEAIQGAVAPLCMPTEEDVEAVCGKSRGIQGHHNSCYLDVTLFSMFTYTAVFDSLLFRPKGHHDISDYNEVQRVLREEIVNPLRKNLFVSADNVMKLRKLLDRLSSVSGLTSEEKDPEEFLNSLLAQILKAEPFLKLNSGQESFYYQLFVEKDQDLTLPTVQQLFEQSFLTSNIKLKEVPSCLILQMPRFGKNYKMYPRILPTQLLDVTDVIEGSPRQCIICGKLARFECTECFNDCSNTGLESTAFCRPCLDTAHTLERRARHRPARLRVPADFEIMEAHCRPPRLFMELFAVICIETSHYVAFVKCGVGHEAPWCFFDSMADRRGERNGYNIPEMVACPDAARWLADESVCRELCRDFPLDRHLPEHARRLLCDAYICMYQSSDVMMYR